MPGRLTPVSLLLLLTALAGCALQVADPGTPCVAASFSVVDNFAGARRGTCRVRGHDTVVVNIRREDGRVTNPSPWFAFKLVPERPVTATVIIDYDTWKHRYRPKISRDGIHWSPLDETDVIERPNAGEAEIRVALGDDPVFVAAQELIVPATYSAWSAAIAERTDAEIFVGGHSLRNQEIIGLDTGGDARRYVLFVGRQHPPEVSGAFAFLRFVETVLADTELATEFRRHYRVIAVPLVNPDGVIGGNWRHNLGGLDLNRDWGDFSQPETRWIGELIDRMESDGIALEGFLDFHSTQRNLFYTQAEDETTTRPGFAERWFAAVRPKVPQYEFSNEERTPSNLKVAKNYIFDRFRIPAYTYEVGDETDRRAAQDAAVVFAEEYMKLMLAE